MTATDNPDDIRKAYNNGANSCLDKPMEFDRMARTIKAVSKYWLVHNRHP
jgi:DNA-binding NarL/FixJ family response regulator